ncbi:VHS domain [Popillia japonica]|uniref:Hepatocyte growth factor-regulated tyrosine kinase substrate n=1 Tax=Popillia japonica TaxID=7064 RepID=A0AAW1JK38_POPJA
MFMKPSSGFEKLLDKATSHLLMEPDWPSILQICDLIRQDDIQPRIVFNGIKKKLQSGNPHTTLFALQLLESVVKNCGHTVSDELTTKAYCDMLHELAKTTKHDNVKQKLLELIQAWNYAFRKNPQHINLRELMNTMKAEGFKFPALQESDAMFIADSAPKWADGEVCHRCRVQFTVVQRKHHCRACGQVFCGQCSQKNTTLPKFGIEKEVRVCDSCYDQHTKPTSAKSSSEKESDLPSEYLKSSLAQQNQAPPRKNEEELREEEELQLAIALSQSEAEAKEKEKMRVTSTYHSTYKAPAPETRPVQRSPSPEESAELSHYLNRSYWETRQSDTADTTVTTRGSPSVPASAPIAHQITDIKFKENGLIDIGMDDFVNTLRSQVEIFINRMKSNSSRGRSIVSDSSVQTLFMSLTSMHSQLLKYIQQHDDSRLHYERLQDKLAQVKDARAALDALREEHRLKLKREAEEAERQRQLQMAHKLEIMRKKKQEYLQYQRQLALQRIQEQEREMQMRQEQQKHQYSMIPPQFGGFIGSPVHGAQFPPNAAPPPSGHYNFQYNQQPMMMQANPTYMGGPPNMVPPNLGPPMQNLPPNMQHVPQSAPQNIPPGQNVTQIASLPPSQAPPQNRPQSSMVPQPQNVPPVIALHQRPATAQNNQNNPINPHFQQADAPPPGSPQVGQKSQQNEAETAELITFD